MKIVGKMKKMMGKTKMMMGKGKEKKKEKAKKCEDILKTEL